MADRNGAEPPPEEHEEETKKYKREEEQGDVEEVTKTKQQKDWKERIEDSNLYRTCLRDMGGRPSRADENCSKKKRRVGVQGGGRSASPPQRVPRVCRYHPECFMVTSAV